nr:hypothetical protein CFP56_00614 [Quercus suber]
MAQIVQQVFSETLCMQVYRRTSAHYDSSFVFVAACFRFWDDRAGTCSCLIAALITVKASARFTILPLRNRTSGGSFDPRKPRSERGHAAYLTNVFASGP